MAKFCIFCGEKPINKNKEHVIPKWLIKMTGDSKRVAHIGKNIKFPWMNYTFPSCETCNSNFATVEEKVKPVVISLLEEKPISHYEFNLFLDWIDKIRIGIWLGQILLHKKDLSPKFHINQRVGEKDRLCLLYKTDDNGKGIGFSGTGTKIFESTPSCFSLTINNLLIFSFSKEFILSKNLGFPYPKNLYYNSNGMVGVELQKGTSKITLPFLDGKIIKPAVKFYQSIIKTKHGFKKPISGKNKKFITKSCMQYSNNTIKSRIYISDEFASSHFFWHKNKKAQFRFLKKFNRDALMQAISIVILEHQISSIKEVLNHLEEFDKNERLEIEVYFKVMIGLNEHYINELKVNQD